MQTPDQEWGVGYGVCVCVGGGLFWIPAQQAVEGETETVCLKMPFHWSKHPSNIVPPMTGEQPGGVVGNDVRKAVLGGGEVWGSAVAQGFQLELQVHPYQRR